MFEREGVDVVGVLFFVPRAAESPQEPRVASGVYVNRKTPESLINGHFRGFFCAYG